MPVPNENECNDRLKSYVHMSSASDAVLLAWNNKKMAYSDEFAIFLELFCSSFFFYGYAL